MGEISASSMVGPSRLQPEAMKEKKEEARRQPRRSQGRVIQGQPRPRRRQSAQLMVITVQDPENGDKDSEMGD